MNLDSLPGRPLRSDEFDLLADSDSIADSFLFAERGNADGRYVLQFVLDLDSEYVALHFDADAEQWKVVGRAPTFEQVTTALTDARPL